MPDLADGESIEVQGSGSSVYTIKNTGGVYACTCPAWRNQSVGIESRTCKHIRKLRGDEAETLRCGAAAALPPRAKKVAEGEEGAAKEPPILLAEAWDGVVNVEGWWISEKLDGVRAYWDGKQFLSRQGNQYLAPDWFTAGLPKEPLDGELWLDRKAFQRTVSIVRRQDKNEQWRQIRYVVFDAPAMSDPFEKRITYLNEFVRELNHEFVTALDQTLCRGVSHLKEELERVESLGGEGLMLRQPASKYVAGRSSSLLKVKTFHDAEAEVIGHQPGAGRHKGRMGALQVRLADGTEFSVGTGFSDAQRDAPPGVGSVITFRYQELSDGGVPRFPSYVGVRSEASASEKLSEPVAPGKTAASKSSAAKKATTASPKTPAAPKTSAAAAPKSAAGTARYFVYQDDKSDKFWEITIDNCDVTVRYGRSGTDGTSMTKSFADVAAADKHANKLIAEKTGKGYEEML